MTNKQPSLPYPILGAALAQVRDSDTWWAVKDCLLFLAFTCVRSGEAREATWDEIDLDNATWSIPAARMKNEIAHRVPLSTHTQELLHQAQEQTGRNQGIIFPPLRGAEYIAAARLSLLIKKLEIPTTTHGMRSSFLNWAFERTEFAPSIAEMALSYYPTYNPLGRDLFRERQVLMQEWTDFLSLTMGPVMPTKEI